MRGLFVTGTDTGVGKTYVAAALASSLRARGDRVAVYKPVLTGLDDPGPYDHELLAAAAGVDPGAVAPHRFGPAVSPHLAASLADVTLDVSAMAADARARAAGSDVVIVEGVGGLLVPLTPSQTVRDLAALIGLPLLVVSRPSLGTINHTLLTLEAARAGGLAVAGVVMTPWPAEPSVMELSNRETIARMGGVEVTTLGRDAPLDASIWL